VVPPSGAASGGSPGDGTLAETSRAFLTERSLGEPDPLARDVTADGQQLVVDSHGGQSTTFLLSSSLDAPGLSETEETPPVSWLGGMFSTRNKVAPEVKNPMRPTRTAREEAGAVVVLSEAASYEASGSTVRRRTTSSGAEATGEKI
jgi:hypothetical protein